MEASCILVAAHGSTPADMHDIRDVTHVNLSPNRHNMSQQHMPAYNFLRKGSNSQRPTRLTNAQTYNASKARAYAQD